MALNYRLIKFSDLLIYRPAQGSYVSGVWVGGVETTFTIKAKVQPLRLTELKLFPESERNRSWVKVYIQENQSVTVPAIRTAQQGTTNGWGADEFVWQGFRYRVMQDSNYNDSCKDHSLVYAARVEVTPN